MEIKFIEHNSPEYFQALELRNEVLRKPLGLSFSKEELENEKEQLHLVTIHKDKIVACLCVKVNSQEQAQIRQMAVNPNFQGHGLGKSIMLFAENYLESKGFREILLKARETVIPFYLKLGYEEYGEFFIEVTLSHRWMKKSLST
jgi:predicted GNAT family N-acyltransferase